MSDLRVVVAGDVIVDVNLGLAGNPGVAERSWAAAGRVIPSNDIGGAALLRKLIEPRAAAHGGTVHGVDPKAKRFSQTYALLAVDEDGKWRLGKFLGVTARKQIANVTSDDPPDADIVVLLDADLGFRHLRAEWPKAIVTDGSKPWVILKTCARDFEGDLWERLLGHHSERLIVVTSIDDLRRRDIQISRLLSWERTAQDLAREMRRNPAINVLSRSRHSIVSFGPAGAVLLSGPDTARLIFDPRMMEGEWEQQQGKPRGGTIGYTVTLAAAVAEALMRDGTNPDVVTAIRRGIGGMRALNDAGYGDEKSKLEFPIKTIVTSIAADPPKGLEEVAVPTDAKWSILETRVPSEHLYELATRVALSGPDAALGDVPHAKIGKLFNVDRGEIESLRSIKSLLTEHVRRRPSIPVSIAVFGPPGSGKSFGVKQVARSLENDETKLKVLTFNLSQFAHHEDLHGAFHQVRDASLSGEIPLVFWDEFDTRHDDTPLGWLRYFLAPMQDGAFQQEQITHPIGGAIFVFAGGTAHEYAQFGADLDRETKKRVKLPDFLSRLKGFLDVLGPNRRKRSPDPYHVIRRAILLRSMLEEHASSLFDEKTDTLQIDPGLLRAFLLTNTYRHGARSMEAVIRMSALTGKTKFERSSLPSQAQLDLHVPSVNFTYLMQEVQLPKDIVDKLTDKALPLLPAGTDKDVLQAFVRAIPQKLATMNYAMTPARDDGGVPLNEMIDELAKNEPLWRDLDVPAILASAGYRIIKLPAGE